MVVQSGADRARITGVALRYKDLESIHRFAKRNRGWQGHMRRFHAWRWETGVFNFFANKGLHWCAVAQDRVEYSKYRDEYLRWRDRPFSERGLHDVREQQRASDAHVEIAVACFIGHNSAV